MSASNLSSLRTSTGPCYHIRTRANVAPSIIAFSVFTYISFC
jgi:hypothetical protein